MSAHQSTQWFWSDWAGDQRGNPLSNEEIARFTTATPTEVESLIAGILEKGAASRDRTGRLFNRRMTRQAEMTARKRMAGQLGGEQTKKKWTELKTLAFSNPARAPARPGATAPRAPPIQSISLNSSSVTVAAREGLGNGVAPKRPDEMSAADLAEMYESCRKKPSDLKN